VTGRLSIATDVPIFRDVGRVRSMNAAGTVVKVFAEAADTVRRPESGLVILLYHRVGARTPVSVDLPIAMFDEQMAVLAETGSTTSVDRAVDGLGSGRSLSGRVAVTFDDGTADFVDTALPILERHGVPATIYVATEHIESGRWFPDSGRPVSWDGLADAVSTGLVTVGSHTHTHALLDRLNADEVAQELDRSRGLIQDRIGAPADHFAYPKALAPSPSAERAVRARFRSAALAGTRANPAGTDVHRLCRSPVQVTDRRRWFDRKLAGGMRLEDELRRVRARYRHEGAAA
jgi:peptidoglycan/xylan/chitin deacetylase (PgdA/CDA1 family)